MESSAPWHPSWRHPSTPWYSWALWVSSSPSSTATEFSARRTSGDQQERQIHVCFNIQLTTMIFISLLSYYYLNRYYSQALHRRIAIALPWKRNDSTTQATDALCSAETEERKNTFVFSTVMEILPLPYSGLWTGIVQQVKNTIYLPIYLISYLGFPVITGWYNFNW